MGNTIGRPQDVPWRKFENNGSWTEQYRHELIQYICSTVPRDGVSNFKLLVLGHVGAGKSSFINAVASIDADEITQVMGCGESPSGMTQRHTSYKVDQELKNFILCDTPCISTERGYRYETEDLIKLDWIGSLLKGHTKPYSVSEQTNSRENVENPSISEKIHCVALVSDSKLMMIGAISDFQHRQIKSVQEIITSYGCPLVVLLTKIDKICGDVNRNISMTFSSRNVETCVKRASEMFGIPVMNIYPVQNYTEQMGLDCKMDILILMAIKHMIKLANGYIKILRNTEDAEHKNSSEDAEHRNSSEDAEHKNSSEDAEHQNSSEDAEHKNSSEDAEHKNSSEEAEHWKSSEDAEQTKV